MYVLVPMDSEDVQEASLVKVADAKVWAQILIEEGEVVEILHADEFDKFENLSEAVVLINDFENPMPFLEYNMMPLVAHTQRSIDDIVEAYLFRELHDMAV
ncbi:hypothetical protein [Sulfurimonas marina]|uniref:Uncharacterized protein n=1 Tax=Sulfurimonas marina TaxID=2590551 RepID=A0A7M1AXD0_9BACT|nr:hypothetical protein [Sulfurimonas marina]QOP42103.1 hypothetical protein FJR03_10280 [Sulfurimonas marina]